MVHLEQGKVETNRIEIETCGVKLRVLTTETKEYIEEIAAYFDNLFKKQFARKTVQGVDLPQRIVMAGITLADDFFKYKKAQETLRGDVERRIQTLTDELAAQKKRADEASERLIKARKEFEREGRGAAAIKKELDETKKQLKNVTEEFRDYIENFK